MTEDGVTNHELIFAL